MWISWTNSAICISWTLSTMCISWTLFQLIVIVGTGNISKNADGDCD